MAPHPQRLTVTRRAWALARPFVTARGVETTVDIVVAEISDVESRGRGEGVPLRRYGESIDSVVAALPRRLRLTWKKSAAATAIRRSRRGLRNPATVTRPSAGEVRFSETERMPNSPSCFRSPEQ